MSLESFAGFDAGEGMSEAGFEAFKEKMKAAAAQIAQIKKEEKKQKRKEDDLLKILLKFVKDSHKKDLVLLISRVLEQNIPANFVLAMILLGNPEIQEAVGEFLMLGEGESNERSLTFFGEDESLPLKLRIEIDKWITNMLSQADESPQKLLNTAYDITVEEERTTKEVKPAIPRLAAYVLRDFLEQNGQEEEYEKLKEFAYFIINGILDKTQETLDNRKALGGEEHLLDN